jgi:hypothetical protein
MITILIAHTINHKITNFTQISGVMKSAAFTGCKIHIIPTAMTHNHRLNNPSINNATNINQNTTISINALGFAIPASANKTHDIIRYLNSFLLNLSIFVKSHKLRIIINHDSIASNVIAITHRSVLLSTNTKNAHIQLVSHISNVDRPKINDVSFAV